MTKAKAALNLHMKGNCESKLVYHSILSCQFPITFHLTSFLAGVWINKKEFQKLSVELIYKKDHGALSFLKTHTQL